MDPVVETFMDGMGAAAATAGFLNQQQGRIFGLLYLSPEPLSLDEISLALQQSKSNVSVNARGLVEWRLAQRVRVEGSRKDHYVAATNFLQVVIEIMERRFRWNVRQVLAASEEAEHALAGSKRKKSDPTPEFIAGRLAALREFFQALDAGLAALGRGTPLPFLNPPGSEEISVSGSPRAGGRAR
jgi:DNA-binding transcriptional regulator GbsR (MarR family)